MTAERTSLSEIAGLLEDSVARRILEETYADPASPAELASDAEASLSTVCRRLDDLEAAGLVEGRTRVRDDGRHDTVYSAALDGVAIDLDEDGFSYEVTRREEDPVDRLYRLWGDL